MSIDLNALKQQIEEAIPWRDGVLTVAQARALISEVEILRQEAKIRNNINDGLSAELRELRAEVADLRMQRDEHLIDNEHAYDEGYDAGTRRGYEAECAAVVAYLRDGTAACRYCLDAAVIELTAHIERGDHRKEDA